MKAYWHYYFIDTQKISTHYKIVAEGKEVLFANPEAVALPNGIEAYRISTLNTEYIEEAYDYLLTFKGVNSATNQEFTMQLPMPDANRITMDSNGEMYVDLYIYI